MTTKGWKKPAQALLNRRIAIGLTSDLLDAITKEQQRRGLKTSAKCIRTLLEERLAQMEPRS